MPWKLVDCVPNDYFTHLLIKHSYGQDMLSSWRLNSPNSFDLKFINKNI